MRSKFILVEPDLRRLVGLDSPEALHPWRESPALLHVRHQLHAFPWRRRLHRPPHRARRRRVLRIPSGEKMRFWVGTSSAAMGARTTCV